MIGPLLIAIWIAAAATPLPARTDRFVYDTAGVIDDPAERTLERRHQELFAKTGVALVVLTVPRLVDETIDQLAVRAGQTWGVGRKGEDRGLVIALARDDREIFVATGYGTEGYLPDGRVGALIDEHALPALRQDQLSAGLVQLASALAAISAAEYEVTLSGAPPPGPAVAPAGGREGPGGVLRIVLLVLGGLGFLLLARRHPMLALLLLSGMGRGRGGGGFGGGFGGGGFGGGGFGGGGAGRGF